jgi:hypothetical protein
VQCRLDLADQAVLDGMPLGGSCVEYDLVEQLHGANHLSVLHPYANSYKSALDPTPRPDVDLEHLIGPDPKQGCIEYRHYYQHQQGGEPEPKQEGNRHTEEEVVPKQRQDPQDSG